MIDPGREGYPPPPPKQVSSFLYPRGKLFSDVGELDTHKRGFEMSRLCPVLKPVFPMNLSFLLEGLRQGKDMKLSSLGDRCLPGDL